MLTAEDAQALEEAGLAIPVTAGMRKILNTTIYSVSAGSENSEDSEPEFVEICEHMESQETLMWLGFNEETAKDLFNTWEQYDPDDPSPFFTFITDYIRYHKMDAYDDQDWNTALRIIGVNDELRATIMDPDFTNLRLGASAKHWILDSMEIRYRILAKASETSQERALRRLQENCQKLDTKTKAANSAAQSKSTESSL